MASIINHVNASIQHIEAPMPKLAQAVQALVDAHEMVIAREGKTYIVTCDKVPGYRRGTTDPARLPVEIGHMVKHIERKSNVVVFPAATAAPATAAEPAAKAPRKARKAKQAETAAAAPVVAQVEGKPKAGVIGALLTLLGDGERRTRDQLYAALAAQFPDRASETGGMRVTIGVQLKALVAKGHNIVSDGPRGAAVYYIPQA